MDFRLFHVFEGLPQQIDVVAYVVRFSALFRQFSKNRDSCPWPEVRGVGLSPDMLGGDSTKCVFCRLARPGPPGERNEPYVPHMFWQTGVNTRRSGFEVSLKAEVLFVVLVLLVAGSFTIGSMGGVGSRQVSTTPPQNGTASCQQGPWMGSSNSTTLSNGTISTRVNWPVFTMQPGSRAVVCVTYYDILNGPGGLGTVYSQPLLWGPNSAELRQTSELSLAAVPNPAYFAPGQNTTVVYDLTASTNATGFYGLYLFQFCAPIPLAVGQNPNGISLNDFPGLFGLRSCPAQVMSAQITGFGGGSVANSSCTLGPLPKSGPQIELCE